MNAQQPTRHNGSPLVADRLTRIIILGTFPSRESLSRREYYANPRNHFWSVLGQALTIDLLQMNYNRRIESLLDLHIGLWDTVESCERSGSLDKSIRNPKFNDLKTTALLAPNLRLLVFNGSKAASYYKGSLNIPHVTAPSTSSANTHMSIAKKTSHWRKILQPILIPQKHHPRLRGRCSHEIKTKRFFNTDSVPAYTAH